MNKCPKCGARPWATFSDIDSTMPKRFECGTTIVAVGLIQAPDCAAAERDHLRLQNAALTDEVERLKGEILKLEQEDARMSKSLSMNALESDVAALLARAKGDVMKVEECKVGQPCEYSPSSGRWFRGTIAAEPWQLGGCWVTKLTEMPPEYGEFTGKSGDKATTVYAASLESMRHCV